MSEWSTSLGYCAADRCPDSDEEEDLDSIAPPEQVSRQGHPTTLSAPVAFVLT